MAALQLCERPIVLFDFDGTVADTGRAVMASTRKTLAARGFSEAQMGDLRRMIGPPLWKSFHDFYGFTREESLVVADEYRAFFDELEPEEYPVFDGISELLDGLAAQGHRVAIATSRMEAKCIDMVRELGLCQFEAVVGMNPPQGRETKADSVRDALAALGATADDAVMIGDRFNDVEGAHAMDVPCIGIYSGAGRRGSTRPRAPMRWCTRWPSLLNFSLYKYAM
ncbi:5'-nucleotidase [Collinsella aerofaciens]|nr:5'-nucleotidase [Collinsella aerofaciens]